MDIKLAVAVFPGGCDMPLLRSTTLREQLNIDVVEGLEANMLGSGVVKINDHMAVHRETDGVSLSSRRVSVSLSAVQQTVDFKEGVSEEGKDYKEALLVK